MSNDIPPLTPIHSLRNLGLASEKALARVGIRNVAELKQMGAYQAYLAMIAQGQFKTSLNFLYALLGALEDKDWKTYRAKKAEILMTLDGYRQLNQLFSGVEKTPDSK